MRGKGLTLTVDESGLAKLVRDLNDTISIDDMISDRGVFLNVRLDDVHHAIQQKEEDPAPPRYIVRLDKWQRRFLENRMREQDFVLTYGVGA